MISYINAGDLLAQNVEALVNTVNCVGVMGRGVALQFKNKFPQNYKLYEAACRRGEVQPGKMFVTNNDMLGVKWIINFPTKRHWRNPSRMVDIERGLDALAEVICELGIKSIALPPLGCGLGGLSWSVVKQVIATRLSSLKDVEIIVFEPNVNEIHDAVPAAVPNMTLGRAILLALSDRYIKEAMLDFGYTLLEVHKLLYFVQSQGLDLRLQYEKAAAGPFAKNLGQVLKHIEGHFITGYNDGGDSPEKILNLVPAAVEKAKSFLQTQTSNWDHCITKVIQLIAGNGDAAYLELLASIHWLYTREHAITLDDVKMGLWQWNERKKRFSAAQINLAYNRLREEGWLLGPDVTP